MQVLLPGIDDMFVIMQCYDNLAPNEHHPGDPSLDVATAMKHAGVAITVTSITDFIVFGVGATTVRIFLIIYAFFCVYFCALLVFASPSVFLPLLRRWHPLCLLLPSDAVRGLPVIGSPVYAY